jgi:hypothetical protein
LSILLNLAFGKKYCEGHNLVRSTEQNKDGDCLTCKEASGSEMQVLFKKYSAPAIILSQVSQSEGWFFLLHSCSFPENIG